MLRALVLHRLNQYRLEPVPAWNKPGIVVPRVYGASVRGTKKYGPKVCGTRTRNQRCLEPQEPVVLRTPGTRKHGACYPRVYILGNQLLVAIFS